MGDRDRLQPIALVCQAKPGLDTGSGDIAAAQMTSTDPSFAAVATREVTGILYRGASVLLPGDKIQVPIGLGAAEVWVSVFGPADVIYALAKIVATSAPRLDRVDTFTQFAMAITADFNSYGNCKNGQNFLGQALCFARFTTGITKAALQLGINTPSVLGVLLAANTFLEWTVSGSSRPGSSDIRHRSGTAAITSPGRVSSITGSGLAQHRDQCHRPRRGTLHQPMHCRPRASTAASPAHTTAHITPIVRCYLTCLAEAPSARSAAT